MRQVVCLGRPNGTENADPVRLLLPRQDPNTTALPQLALKVSLDLGREQAAFACSRTGYAVGSIEGRCSIAYIEDSTKNFAFKCSTLDELRIPGALDAQEVSVPRALEVP